MADPCVRRLCLMFLSFIVYAGMMAVVVLAAFDFGRDFGVFKNRTGEMLQKYSLPITPTRLVYDYWYLLYGIQIFFHAYAFSSLCRNAHTETPVPIYKLSLCPSVMFGLCIANNLAIILWLFLWDREYTVAALIVIAVAPSTFYIAFYHTCRGLYLDLALLHNSKADGESWAVRYLVHNVIGFLAAWLTISFVYSLGVVLVNEIGIDIGVTSLALFGALMLELLIWLWVDVFLLDDFTRYTVSTYFPMIVVTICLVVEVSANAAWDRFKICVVVATALALACLVVKLIFLIYRHKKKPFLKVVKPSTKKTEENITVASEETEGKNGNGSVTVITEEKSSKKKSKKEEQTKAIVNELHSKFEGGSKAKKGKGKQSGTVEIEDHCHTPEVEEVKTTVEVVDEIHDESHDEKANSSHSASTAAVQEVDVHEESEEPVVPPVDYDQDEEPHTETPRVENVIPVPQPMELTRENVEMVSHSAEAGRYEGDDVFNEPGDAVVKTDVADDNTNDSVEAQGSDEENEVDDFSEIPPPTDDLLYSQDYPDDEDCTEENVAEPEDYPPAPEPLDVPEVPTGEARSTSIENDAIPQEHDTTGNGFHNNSQRLDIDGTAKTLEEESDGEGSPAKFAPSDADIVQAEVHSYDNKNFENYSNGMETECTQTDSGKVYQLPDENSDDICDSSDEGEVTLA